MAEASNSGPVTCVTISSDLTYIAVGHATGNIHLYDLPATPTGLSVKPARTTLALTLNQVLSGRKEGHLQGSRILHIGFVGKRHTSIVSGDEDGRAFWWSLGKVLGVESNDVVRMLGSYPEPGTISPTDRKSNPAKRPTTLFAALPLPLGAASHETDSFDLTVLLTPAKLVVVGMKPSARTWYRKLREATGGPGGGTIGCAAWLRAGEVEGEDEGEVSDPVLAYSWGTAVRFFRVKCMGVEIESGGKASNEVQPEFVEGRRYNAPSSVRALQWYDQNVSTCRSVTCRVLMKGFSMSPW
jgi:WD40 repeat protein